jgi:hypothetical protein
MDAKNAKEDMKALWFFLAFFASSAASYAGFFDVGMRRIW